MRMIRFLLDKRIGFFLAAILFCGFGIWMLVDPGVFAEEGSAGRLSVNRRMLAAIWGNAAGVILVVGGVANLVAGILGRAGGDSSPEAV